MPRQKKELREKSGLRSLAERAEEEESLPEGTSEARGRLGESSVRTSSQDA